MESVLNRFSSIAESALYLQDLFDFFNLEPEIVSKPNPIAFPKPVREGFVFENVSFHYPNREDWVLREVSFQLGPREKLALVGENGAGKTTLVKLDEGRFARAVFSHQCQFFPRTELKGNLTQNPVFTVRVMKTDVFENKPFPDRFGEGNRVRFGNNFGLEVKEIKKILEVKRTFRN